MRSDIRRLFVWMAVFFIAMAFLESAVVVYLRALYYPEGFDFPLAPMAGSLVVTEVWREAATLIMLLVPAALVTRSAVERFAWFCFGFGIWDIFYYIWLKVLLGWPAGLGSRDLLFLIPVPWVGPVWAPCVVSLGMILLALMILRARSKWADFRVGGGSWLLLTAGALLLVISFTLDPLRQSFGLDALTDMALMADSRATAFTDGRSYIPEKFPWPWFAAGCALALGAVGRIHKGPRRLMDPADVNRGGVDNLKPSRTQPR
ncbi:MAG TPA: hypothetical protein VKG92_02195 [Flavobacteriales bacterium]|nr:hypothetical protein [Flavobacteriales bacterium]